MNPEIKDIIDLFSEVNPATVHEARWILDKTFRPIGTGVFRQTYRINKLPIIVKFPKHRAGIDHSYDEMEVLNRIEHSKKLRDAFKKHLPKVYYFNKTTGVILMKEYMVVDPRQLKHTDPVHIQYKTVNKNLKKMLSKKYDLDENQWGVDDKDNLIVLDWGFVGNDEKYEWWNKIGYKQDVN